MTAPNEPAAPGWPSPAAGWGASPPGPPPASPPATSPPPTPPAPLVVAAVLALLGVVAVVVGAATGGAAAVLTGTDWLTTDADAVAALLAVALVAALVGGTVGALAGRGGGLLLTAGAALAVVAGAVAVGTAVVDGVGEEGVRFGLAVATALVGIALAVLAVLAPSTAWYRTGERRAAERVVAGVLAGTGPGRDQVAGRGPGWAIGAALFAVATVGAAALVAGGVSADGDDDGGVFGPAGYSPGAGPDDPFEPDDPFGPDPDSGPGIDTAVPGEPVPVDESDPEYDRSFDEQAEECRAGDLDACDTLYYGTPIDSEYEEYGSTCGGRTSEEYYGTCADEFD
ncbi:hypothetical protein [Blastococcus sp. TF02A-26]|uniref:hypothetical protein n=1 Tax=Blastococcus sp. TF02A-26 TaxID=2250577 RepID=UPI000DE8864E|nr:hypothetical protein [Blastococcus sp. TF02A-26]RBY89911.1 hypothetical protein DQ240_03155 [Blastococcus sp. TF02A-26]